MEKRHVPGSLENEAVESRSHAIKRILRQVFEPCFPTVAPARVDEIDDFNEAHAECGWT